MLRLDPEAYSLRWYREIFENPNWMLAIRNSFVIGIAATISPPSSARWPRSA
jgi:putative spermidine/putrescine transport system permease protein